MTDRDSLLRNILTNPADDLPRLVYADWCDEHGEGERAEFIRVQVELAKGCQRCGGDGLAHGADRPFEWNDRADYGKCVVCWDSRCRERELLKANFGVWTDVLPESLVTQQCQSCIDGVPDYETNVIECRRCDSTGVVSDEDNVGLSRGFISSVTCSWQDWLAHHERLFWHPEQTVDCDGSPVHIRGIWRCSRCGMDDVQANYSLGCESRIPRPFVATAQPLEVVALTTAPTFEEERRYGRKEVFTGPVDWAMRSDAPLANNHTEFAAWPGLKFGLTQETRDGVRL